MAELSTDRDGFQPAVLAFQQQALTQKRKQWLSPAKLKNPCAVGEPHHWYCHPGVNRCPCSYLHGGSRDHRKDHTVTREVNSYWKNTGAFSPMHSPLPTSCISTHTFFPFYSLQNIVRCGTSWKALNTSILGLTTFGFLKVMRSVKHYLYHFNSSFNYSFKGISCMYMFRAFGPQTKHSKYLLRWTVIHTLINMFSSLQ